jgi:hypothetical protein
MLKFEQVENYKHSIKILLRRKNLWFLSRTNHYTNTLGNIQKAHRTNSTFGFCRHAKPTLKKPKELFFANARLKNEQNTGNRNKRNRMNSIFRNIKPTDKIWS